MFLPQTTHTSNLNTRSASADDNDALGGREFFLGVSQDSTVVLQACACKLSQGMRLGGACGDNAFLPSALGP